MAKKILGKLPSGIKFRGDVSTCCLIVLGQALPEAPEHGGAAKCNYCWRTALCVPTLAPTHALSKTQVIQCCNALWALCVSFSFECIALCSHTPLTHTVCTEASSIHSIATHTQASGLNWTVVRPGGLSNDPPSKVSSSLRGTVTEQHSDRHRYRHRHGYS